MAQVKVGDGEGATEYVGELPHAIIRPIQSYSTVFPLTEDPISESGRWANGLADGSVWQNCKTNGTMCFGSGHTSAPPPYDDPTAVLKGTWGPNQTVQATVFSTNQQSGSIFEEVELRLRSIITPNVNSGYEITFRCTSTGYVQINRWNGALNSFTQIFNVDPGPGISTGSKVKAIINGSKIQIFIDNGGGFAQVGSTYDTAGDSIRFDQGNPGLGFYLEGTTNTHYADFGFTAWSATES